MFPTSPPAWLNPQPSTPAPRGCLVALLLAFATGCTDPMDVVGVEEVVTQVRQQEPPKDDQLSDKHPTYDPARTVVEEFNGCQVTLNKSASVTRLTLQSSGPTDAALRGKVFRTRDAALEALAGAPTLPTMEVVNGALKPFNDGLYAAVELGAEHGDASLVDKHRLLLDLLAELTRRASQGGTNERAPALAAATHIATALTLGGDAAAVPASLAPAAAQIAAQFEADRVHSKPIGFYTWTPQLESIFTRDRFLQTRWDDNPGAPFPALAELGLLVGQKSALADAYHGTLNLYAGLTDPAFDASPFELAPFVPDDNALGDLPAVERSFAATLPAPYPAFPFCNPGLAAFPASESAENRVMRQLLCGSEPAEGETLLDGLIRKIQSGAVDLTPRQNSGFYDQQLYALETLLVPERARESEHLLLTQAYKQKLIETFKSLLIQTRETHAKQVGIVNATASSGTIPPIEFAVYPKLVVEPFPTFYLRTARAYRFLEGVLNAALGPEFLRSTARLLEDGTRAAQTLTEELGQREQLLYGLHALAADSIGMAPELTDDESGAFPLATARDAARVWLAQLPSDPDVARDPRVSLPVALETDPETNIDYAIYWAVVGVKVLHLHASFPEAARPEVVSSAPVQQFGHCVQKGWETFEPYMLVEQTIQVRRPLARPPLTREEFRALCDAHDTGDDIARAFEAAP